MANKKQQKLELTWIGKGEEPTLEPRILIENPEYSYGDPKTENLLIHGDNLLVLKALEQDYAGKVKCIYIDPPYNTGSRIDSDGKEVGYEDGIEHSEWLSMMKPRLELLKTLLHDDGTLAIQIDDNEFARLYLLLLEVFNSQKNLKTICVKMSEATGVKMAHVVNSGRIPKLKEYIIIARKNGIKNLFVERIPKDKWDNEYKIFAKGVTKKEVTFVKEIMNNIDSTEKDIEIADTICSKMQFSNINELFEIENIKSEEDKLRVKYENSWRIFRDVATTGGAKIIADKKRLSNSNSAFLIVTPKKKKYLIKSGYNVDAAQPRIKLLFADDYLTIHPGDFWQDIKTTGLDNEGGVTFKKGKKPEALVKRIIGMASNEGDIVLDSFIGSGTTGAVATKMNRKWIGVEMGPHCFTHCIPRIKNVIDGRDSQGITTELNWQGGGGFKFYELAPSLLNKDKYDNWVINKEYNPTMLAAAMAKQEGFTYAPDKNTYWKQGYSAEQDFIFTTTQFVTVELLDQLQDQLQEGESLLICAKKFQPECRNKFKNIVLKKIPKMLLGKCEFGKEDYSLNIINPPVLTEEELGNEE
ncbi:site-specific DNA-methyltransferase [Nonlabens xiamenensis]|uniref:site-specific DNA-methyltransferase n=1 Tax=Nonlabens xiamenensis TaxID=2341043 RepID=UPI000F60B843|nr:site-specific DNA-methyltransferase [Nonlabens xiamenensis]